MNLKKKKDSLGKKWFIDIGWIILNIQQTLFEWIHVAKYATH